MQEKVFNQSEVRYKQPQEVWNTLLKLFSSILVTGCFGISSFNVNLLCKSLVGSPLVCPMISH